jgi:hypothetical protein
LTERVPEGFRNLLFLLIYFIAALESTIQALTLPIRLRRKFLGAGQPSQTTHAGQEQPLHLLTRHDATPDSARRFHAR